MKRTRIVMVLAASLVSVAAWAHWPGGNAGSSAYGPGMMGSGMGMMGPGMGMGMMGPGMMMDGWAGEPGNCAAAARGRGFASGLDLTEEQRAKIVDIQREAHADARKRVESVLTDEQKQKLRSAAGPRW